MANSMNSQDALDALHRHYGGTRFQAERDAGLDLMKNALRQETGISEEEAEETIRELESANSIRWVSGTMAPDPEPGNEDIVPSSVQRKAGHITTSVGAQGYWELA